VLSLASPVKTAKEVEEKKVIVKPSIKPRRMWPVVVIPDENPIVNLYIG
jgi:hypothetical protein